MKKLLALLLALCTLLSCMMIAVSADEEEGEPEPEVEDKFKHEIYTFRVYEDSEKLYLAYTNAGDNGNQRFSDANLQTIYHYTIRNIYSIESIIWTAKLGAQLHLQITQDPWSEENDANVNWTTFYKFAWDESMAQDKGDPAQMYEFDLTEYFDPAKGGDFFIRIADATTDNGWGGSIYKEADNTLDVAYTPLSAEELDAFEAAGDENSISLHGMNKDFAGFTFDTEDQRAGSACAVVNVGKGFVNQQTFDPIDGTGYDTLEFDWYLSDVAILEKFQGESMNSGIELTSAGKCDAEEISWKIPDIVGKNVNGELHEGWNHVVLYLAEGTPDNRNGAGEFRINAINFIRIFMVNETEDTGITLKYDNFRLTKAYAKAVEDAKAAAQAYIDKIQAALDAAKDGITEDNLKAVKNAYNSANRTVENLKDELVAAQISAELRKSLKDLGKAIEDFENGANETAAPETAGDTQADAGEETKDAGSSDDDGKSNTGLIIGIAAAAVILIAVVVFIIIKKKK